MVEPDRAEHRDVSEDQVRRVPRAAHPHLEHAQADGLVGEPEIGDRGERLEVGEPPLERVDTFEVGHESCVFLRELVPSHIDAADGQALVHRPQVR